MGWVGNVVLHDITHRVMQEQLGVGGNFLGHNTPVWLVNTDIPRLIKTIGCEGQKLVLQASLN